MVLSNVISSQVAIHQKYGGVYPALAKRAHQERIDFVVKEAIEQAIIHIKSEYRNPKSETNLNIQNTNFQNISNFELRASNFPLSAIAVTQGPGLAIALEVGIKKAKELSIEYKLPLIAINHLEGHIYACLAQNSKGQPKSEMFFPSLCLVVSGGHTGFYLTQKSGQYQLLGETLDDACGEALDKAAKILKLGYPGGPIIERLSEKQKLPPKYKLSQPLRQKDNLNFSYSGLKTQFLYLVQSLDQKEFNQNIKELAFAFQSACFEQIIRKTLQAIKKYQPKMLLCGGGVISNKTLRKQLRQLCKKEKIQILFPPKKNLITDNAAMIGIAAYDKFLRNEFVQNLDDLDRIPRMPLE